MIDKLIAFSVENKFIVGLLTLALVFGGIYSLKKVPVDAVPDITNNQVQVITQTPNLGTQDIEQLVTYPVELAVANLPGVVEIRSISRFGLSVVTVVFEENMGIYLPRQLISEKLDQIKSSIPEGFGQPFMGPISTGLGEIYQYTLEVAPEFKDKYKASELRSIQDWIISRQMAMVPGVVEVNAFGGIRKQYEVAIDPNELRAIHLNITDVYRALSNNNQNTGGAYIEKNHQAYFIRGEGLVRSLEDVKNIVVSNQGGIPIRIKDIATVKFGSATRYGALTKNGEGEAVGGMIMMLKGAKTNQVIENVQKRIGQIQKSLPEGVTIKPFLDRSDLITKTTSTIKENLIIGALIVIFILVFLLGNWRGGLVVASTIPLSLLFAFILMHIFGVLANLMSLGAIDFGIIVDGAVIIVESTVSMLFLRKKKANQLTAKIRDDVTKTASSRMMNTAFFGQFIILIVFLPILTLEGVEGKMFIPMALTFSFAMIGAMLLCLTYVPMMTSLFLRVPKKQKRYLGDRIVHWLENKYENVLLKALKKGKIILVSALVLLIVSLFVFGRMGSEFIPKLDEGDFTFHAILKPGTSLSQTVETTTKIEKMVKSSFPEVKDVISRIGVAEVPTDPMPMDIADVFVILKPKNQWVSASSKEELIDKVKQKVSQIPGVNYEFTQPIEMRFNELITGVREDIAIKLYGEDLKVLSQKGQDIAKIVSGIKGVADMKVEATTGQPQITVRYNRDKIAQYGLQIKQLNNIVQTAFAGGVAGTVFEGEKRFNLVVRFKKDSRRSLNDVKNLLVSLSNGAQIPLKEVAQISYQPGPMQISRDNTNRRIYVGINVRGRDIKSLVTEIQREIESRLKLPPGYYIRYGGAFENLERATSKLEVVVPIVLGLIFILIFFALKSFKQTLMIYMAIPLAIIGGIFSLLIRGMPFSISAGVGFIVLFGVAVLNGLVLISGFNQLKEEGVTDVKQRIKMGTRRRIRPILLTALTDIFGFLPMALSSSSGAEVQQPLATVVIGGLLSATLLTLFVIPILYQWVEGFNFRRIKNVRPDTAMISLLLVLSGFGVISAQSPTISMEKAVAMSLENHPSMRVAKLSVDKEKALKLSAWDFGTTKLFNGGEEIGPNGEPTYTLFGIRQSGIDIFGISPKNRLAKQRIKRAETTLMLNRLDLKKKVQLAWAKAYVQKRIYKSYKQIDSVFSGLKKAISLRFETQAISELEYNATVNQGEIIRLKKERALSSYQVALEELNQWLWTEVLYDVDDSIVDIFDSTMPILSIDLKEHPLVNYWQQNSLLAKYEKKVTNSQFLPKLLLQYGFQKIGNQYGFSSYQIGLSIPLFSGKARAKAKASKINIRMVEQENKYKKRQLETQFNSMVIDFKQSQKSWRYYKNQVLPLTAQQRNGVVISYKEGAMDYMAFIQQIKQSIELEISAWQVLQQYLDSKIQLNYFLNQKN